MAKVLQKVLAGWDGVWMDATYWLYVIRFEGEIQDFWAYLGAWLEVDEDEERYPTSWDQFLFDLAMDTPLTEEEWESVEDL